MSEGSILIVEDEAKIMSLIASHLSDLFDTSRCTTFAEFEHLIALPSISSDIVLLDRMMDGQDTANVLKRFKEKFPQCRILVMSAINTPAEKAALLDLGADDYLSKPFAWEELVARIRSLLRRGSREVRFGNVTLDTVERTIAIDGVSLVLSNKEFLLLRAFIQNPGKVFSKQALFESVWNMSPDVESNAVETTITKLRRRLEECGAHPKIVNSRNLGYWLEE